MVTRYRFEIQNNEVVFVPDPAGIAVAYTDYTMLEGAYTALNTAAEEAELLRLLRERYPSMTPITYAMPVLDRPVLGVTKTGKLGVFARMGAVEQWEWKAQSNPADLMDPAGIVTSPEQDIFGWVYLPGFEQGPIN